MFYATGRARLAAQVTCPDSLYHSNSRAGFVPRLVNGRPVKAWNQWYNKRMKELKKQLPKEERERVTKQMERMTNKRNRRMHHYLALFLGTIVEEKVSADDGEYARWEKGVDRCTSWWWRTSSAWHSCCVASCWRSATRLISRTTGRPVSIWP